MVCFRLCERRYRALDGAGARLHGGRWNSPGGAVVYACSNRALAALELLVRAGEDVPQDLVLLAIEVPDRAAARRFHPPDLPPHWDAIPAGKECRDLGDEWLRDGSALTLEVPSVLIPEESNLLINPGHSAFEGVRVVGERRFGFDRRLAR